MKPGPKMVKLVDLLQKSISAVKLVDTKEDGAFEEHLSTIRSYYAQLDSQQRKSKANKLVRLVKPHLIFMCDLLGKESTSIYLQHALLKQAGIWAQEYSHYPTLRRQLIRYIVKLWSSSFDTEIRLASTVLLHKLVSQFPATAAFVARKMSQAFGEACKSFTEKSFPIIRLMMNGLVEVVDACPVAVVYHHFIKTCKSSALIIENATKHRANYNDIYCWKFLINLVWLSRVLPKLSTSGSTTPAYEGAVMIFSRLLYCCFSLPVSGRSLVFHLHLASIALETGMVTNQTHCVLNSLLQVLNKSQKPVPKSKNTSRAKQYTLENGLNLTEAELQTQDFMEFVGKESLYLLNKLLVEMERFFIFPEVAERVCVEIVKLLKTTKSSQSKLRLKVFLSKIQHDMRLVLDFRATNVATRNNYLDCLELNSPSLTLTFQLPNLLGHIDGIRSKQPLAAEPIDQPRPAKKPKLKEKKSRASGILKEDVLEDFDV